MYLAQESVKQRTSVNMALNLGIHKMLGICAAISARALHCLEWLLKAIPRT
jgi:hypothetical protein